MASGDRARLDDRARSRLQAIVDEAAHAVLAQVARRKAGPVSGKNVGVARGDGVQAVVFLTPYERWTLPPGAADRLADAVASLSGQAADSQNDRLTPTETAILEAAASTPMPVKALARRAGCKMNSHFRATVAKLVRARRLVRTSDGVALP